MRQVGSDARGVDNIEKGELINQRGELQEEGQRLMAQISDARRSITFLDSYPPVQCHQRHQQQLFILCQNHHDYPVPTRWAFGDIPALTILILEWGRGWVPGKVESYGGVESVFQRRPVRTLGNESQRNFLILCQED